jgi:hypothetical protein
MSAAIALSFQELRAVSDPNQVRSIFLLTDGHANRGLTTQHDLVELTRNCWSDASIQSSDLPMQDAPSKPPRFKSFFRHGRTPSHKGSMTQTSDASETSTWTDAEPDHPISLFCFGYGADHNSEILRAITNVTETGSYYFVKDDSNVGPAFGSAFGGILSVVGQSAALTLQPCSGATIKAVHYESAIQRDDGSYNVSVGDFYAEESRDVVVEVTLVTVNSAEAVPHLAASLAYTDVVRKMPIRGQAVVCSIARPSGTEVSPDNIHVSAQWLRVAAAQTLAEAAQLANRNDKSGARRRLQSVKDQLRAAPDAVGKNDMIGMLLNDVDTMMCLQDDDDVGALELSYKCQVYQQQRSSAATTETQPAFRSSRKQAMARKFALP